MNNKIKCNDGKRKKNKNKSDIRMDQTERCKRPEQSLTNLKHVLQSSITAQARLNHLEYQSKLELDHK